jgi:LemA protein
VIIVIVAAVVIVGFVWLTYNRMVGRRLAVDNSWAQIEAALKRRHDLIPNLVEAVKGYAKHERTTFENVTNARAAAMSARQPDTQAAEEGSLNAAIRQLMAVAEDYPQLRATENFQQLSTQLAETEDQIQVTRRVYNDTVQTYNTLIQIFPPSLVAGAFNFKAREFFDAPAGDEAVPEARFGDGGTPEPAGGAAPKQ